MASRRASARGSCAKDMTRGLTPVGSPPHLATSHLSARTSPHSPRPAMTRLALLAALFCALPGLADDAKPLSRIAFGCCSDQDKPLPILDRIADLKPDVYLATGDNIYVDLKREA